MFGIFAVLLPFLTSFSVFAEAQVVIDKINLSFVMGFTGCFIAGYYIFHSKISKKTELAIYILGIIGVLCTVGLTIYASYRQGKPMQTFYDYLMPNCLMPAIAVFVFFKQRVSRLKFSDWQLRRIATLSKLSFGIYLIHDFFIRLLHDIGLTTVSFTPFLSVPVITLICFAFSFAAAWLLYKIPVFNKYMM